MHISVILSTYNAPDWLEKAVLGYHHQHYRDFELVIADDGSRPETAARIAALRERTGLPIVHVWQRDDGFRKCRILNKAVLHARHDYLVFSDGDCIPRADFLAVHATLARPGHYLSGGYCKLGMAASEAIDADAIRTGDCFDLAWLRAHGQHRARKDLKLAVPAWLAPWLDLLTPTRCNFKGSNGSAWRDDVIAVNGFDERMVYGSEDREFGVRLRNYGVKPRQARHRALCLHLDHPRGYVDEESYARNRALRRYNQAHGIDRTTQGIAELRAGGYLPAAGSS